MKVIAIYPTNALVIDQKSQVENFIKRNNRLYNSQDYHIQAITSDLLTEERKLYPDETGLPERAAFESNHSQGTWSRVDIADQS